MRPVGEATVSVTGDTGEPIFGSHERGEWNTDNRGALNIRMWCTDGSYHQTEFPYYMAQPY